MTQIPFLTSSRLMTASFLLALAALSSPVGRSYAQTPVNGADSNPPQMLFQEETPKAAPEQKADSPPSLSDFLKEKVPSTKEAEDAPPSAPSADNSSGFTDFGLGADSFNMALSASKSVEEEAQSEEEDEKKKSADLRQEAFDAAVDKMLPMKPSEIRKLLELYDETSQAAETPIYPNPEPESVFRQISLEPGAKPLTIKTAMGNVTTVSIVDVTGQPWPIQDLTWAGDFQIEQPEQGSHMLRITPTSKFATGNVSMRIVGLNPPVIFSLRTERKSVHVRLDVQVPEVGPNGVIPPVVTPVMTKAGDDVLTSVLVGVVKGPGAQRLKVDGVDGRTSAYEQGGMMYIRTPYTMLSPSWLKSVQSADGMKVYALNYTPVVLLSDKGQMVRAYVTHKESVDEQ